jgi:predicted nucleic acid-binding Zn ribbon protein
MVSPNDPGDRPVTTCPKCRAAYLKALLVASNFVFLRCGACTFLFVIEDRRGCVRTKHQGWIFSQ